jgi:hypothetical protein
MKKSKAKTSGLFSSLPTELTTVTTTSKLLAVCAFVILPFMGFLIGVRYGEFIHSLKANERSVPQNNIQQEVACTMEARMCPDGSYVGRSGPSCEFEACPNINY